MNNNNIRKTMGIMMGMETILDKTNNIMRISLMKKQ